MSCHNRRETTELARSASRRQSPRALVAIGQRNYRPRTMTPAPVVCSNDASNCGEVCDGQLRSTVAEAALKTEVTDPNGIREVSQRVGHTLRSQ
jgi:hypothetical protein